jgi:AcrR family transcriptional regulator
MTVQADPKILDVAERLFKERGYHSIVLADIAEAAGVALPAVQSHYADKEAVMLALLEKHSPKAEMLAALRQIRSGSAEDMVRDAMRLMIDIFNRHNSFAELAVIDMQVNEGAYIAKIFSDLTSEGASFVMRLAGMPGMRPVSSIMLGRAFASMIVGFMATQHVAPQMVQFAMRMFPQDAWVDGMADIFLYGILEPE